MNLIHITASAPLFTNTFLILTRADHGIVIDPAADASVYLRRIEQENARLTHILLTHGHYDHVGAVVELQQKTGAAVYVQPEDTREVIDITKLNAEIEQIVAREQVLRDEIAKIIAEIEG